MRECAPVKNLMKLQVWGVLAIGATSMAPGQALGKVNVPEAVYSQDLTAQAGNAGSKVKHIPGSFYLSFKYDYGTVTAASSIVLQPNLTLGSAVNASSATGYAAGGSVVQMLYYFQVVGPSAISVPVIITASGSLNTYVGDANNAEEVSLEAFPNTGSSEAQLTIVCPTGSTGVVLLCGSYQIPVHLSVLASTVSQPASANGVEIQTSVSTGDPDGPITVSYPSATLTVNIAVDPSFAEASRYHVIVSPRVGNE